jgi:PhzF family phenazine biosynthesis protein
VRAGREQLIVPLASAAAVERVQPRADMLRQLPSAEGASMVYVFAPLGVRGPEGNERVLARFFFPQGPLLLEDPATGSATANLGGWCLAMQRPLPLRFDISQGAAAGRPSRLHLEVDAQHGIHVSGDVLELGRGTVTL